MRRTSLPALAMLASVGAWAWPSAEISTEPALPVADRPFTITIDAMWPDGCGPRVERIGRRDPDTIEVVLARQDDRICFSAFRDYRLQLTQADLPPRLGPGVYRFEVLADWSDGDLRLDGFRMLEIADPDAAQTRVPEAGAWWPERGGRFDTSGPGSGVSLDVQNGVITAIVHGYDDDGRQQWLLAAGPWQGRTFRSALFHTDGGQPLFGDYRPPREVQPVAWLDLVLLSPSRAEAWISREGDFSTGLQVQALSLTRFLFASSADERSWLGDWILVYEDPLRAPRRFRLDRELRTGDALLAVEASQTGERLRCQIEAARPDTLPQRCELEFVDGSGLVFDAVGHERSFGGQAGGGWQLIRLAPGLPAHVSD